MADLRTALICSGWCARFEVEEAPAQHGNVRLDWAPATFRQAVNRYSGRKHIRQALRLMRDRLVRCDCGKEHNRDMECPRCGGPVGRGGER